MQDNCPTIADLCLQQAKQHYITDDENLFFEGKIRGATGLLDSGLGRRWTGKNILPQVDLICLEILKQQLDLIFLQNVDLSRDYCTLYTLCTHCTLYRTEDLREWGDLIRSCVVKKKDEFGQVGLEVLRSFLPIRIINSSVPLTMLVTNDCQRRSFR